MEAGHGIAAHLVRAVPPQTKVALLLFNDKAYLANFSIGQEGLVDQLRSLQSQEAIEKVVYGATALYTALVEATKSLGSPEPGDAIFAITDGTDNVSVDAADNVANLLVHSRVRLYAVLFPEGTGPIAVGPRGLLRRGARQFVALASATGGRVLTLPPKKRGQKSEFQLSGEADEQFRGLLHRRYGIMTEAYEIAIELPESLDKPREWKLELVPSPGLKPADYQLAFPQTLLPCEAGAAK